VHVTVALESGSDLETVTKKSTFDGVNQNANTNIEINGLRSSGQRYWDLGRHVN